MAHKNNDCIRYTTTHNNMTGRITMTNKRSTHFPCSFCRYIPDHTWLLFLSSTHHLFSFFSFVLSFSLNIPFILLFPSRPNVLCNLLSILFSCQLPKHASTSHF